MNYSTLPLVFRTRNWCRILDDTEVELNRLIRTKDNSLKTKRPTRYDSKIGQVTIWMKHKSPWSKDRTVQCRRKTSLAMMFKRYNRHSSSPDLINQKIFSLTKLWRQEWMKNQLSCWKRRITSEYSSKFVEDIPALELLLKFLLSLMHLRSNWCQSVSIDDYI